MNSKNIVTMRNLIEESTHDFYTSIAPQNVEKISITIPEGIINTAANGLLEDQSKILAWFGLDTTNTVSNYELSVNGQDITNGRLKNAKHFMRSCNAWYEKNIEFYGLMYLQPYGRADFCRDDWFHTIDVLMKYGFSYGFVAIGEMSTDKHSVAGVRFYLMDFFGTVYTTDDTGDNKVFRKNEQIHEKFMDIIGAEADAFYKLLRSS